MMDNKLAKNSNNNKNKSKRMDKKKNLMTKILHHVDVFVMNYSDLTDYLTKDSRKKSHHSHHQKYHQF